MHGLDKQKPVRISNRHEKDEGNRTFSLLMRNSASWEPPLDGNHAPQPCDPGGIHGNRPCPELLLCWPGLFTEEQLYLTPLLALRCTLHLVTACKKAAFHPTKLLLKISCRAKKAAEVYFSGAKQMLWQVPGKSWLTWFFPLDFSGHRASQMP